MRIIETNINDIQENVNSNILKINLANDVIELISPLYNKEYMDKLKEIKNLKDITKNKKNKINYEKLELENLLKDYSKLEKESKLLNKIDKLIQTGLIQDSMKNEMLVLLKSFDNISEERILSYLNETMNILSQKFAK